MQHALTNWNYIWQVIQKRGVPGFAWDLNKGYRALRFRGAKKIGHCSVRCKVAQLAAVVLRQLITDEEGIPKGGKLRRGAANKDLAHGGKQVGFCSAVVFHPFRK